MSLFKVLHYPIYFMHAILLSTLLFVSRFSIKYLPNLHKDSFLGYRFWGHTRKGNAKTKKGKENAPSPWNWYHLLTFILLQQIHTREVSGQCFEGDRQAAAALGSLHSEPRCPFPLLPLLPAHLGRTPVRDPRQLGGWRRGSAGRKSGSCRSPALRPMACCQSLALLLASAVSWAFTFPAIHIHRCLLWVQLVHCDL